MKQIYLVMSCTNYEGCAPIRAYESEQEAKVFSDACTKYQETKPEFPGDHDDDIAFEAYCNLVREWEEAHPAGRDDDSFHVRAIEFVTAD